MDRFVPRRIRLEGDVYTHGDWYVHDTRSRWHFLAWALSEADAKAKCASLNGPAK